MHRLAERFHRLTLGSPWLVWLLLAALLGVAAWQAQNFRLDASTDSLIIEGDKDLAYYRTIAERYGSQDFLVVTYSPAGDAGLFSDATLQHLKRLRDELADLPFVDSVMSILDVPLIQSPPVTLREIQQEQRTLLDEDTDRELAKKEFRTSPLYEDLVMNEEGTVTALLVNLKPDERANALLDRRQSLRQKRDAPGQQLSEAERQELARVEAAYDQQKAENQAELQQRIDRVRGVLDKYRDEASIFLGGVPMMASDMIDFVRNDIATFGVGVALFILLLLAISFRRPRWVVVPSAICAAATLATVGYLGFMDWRVTIVSSNFISLLLILSLSLTIHLVVRYRELHAQRPDALQQDLLRGTVESKFLPSVFTVLTTVVSFASLAVSGIRPVIDFGLMMTVGVCFAFVLTFVIFPTALVPLRPGTPAVDGRDMTAHINRGLARFTERAPTVLGIGFLLIAVVAAVGISRLSVENRFIDYFHESTEIYQGMVVIDQELGGTTPLDVIIDAPQWFEEEQQALAEMDLPDLGGGGLTAESYWYNARNLKQVVDIHDYIDAQPETGKVLSMATTTRMFMLLNAGQWPGDFVLALLHRMMPKELKEVLFDPYMADDGNQVRFAVRVVDSDPDLRRDEFLDRVRSDLIERFELEPEQVHLTGPMVLYNNVIQSLYQSQAQTLGVVFVAIGLMFLLLFRSVKMAVIGVAPTVLAALTVLGVMGWFAIPLDIMTITIAAITIGIGVHDTIHYSYRYRDEVQENGYEGATLRSHLSVGRAMFYTTLVVTLGFSILTLSNFVPTILFGLFTGVAMVFALLANMTLLPLLLQRLKPF
ncbi:efflux RND transporter permease subunit [Algiphilus sp.]|uniref:efflux RND transporter permease subunit n=1 Tax=Algiphilus sp. TaxID=1872431 RepID=UPI003B522C2B